jgi:hypothetical protein
LSLQEPRDQDPAWTTSVPFTYDIDYAPGHVGSESYIAQIAEAPPVLLHVGHDVPFKSMYGPSDLYDSWSRRMLRPKEIEERIDLLKSYVSGLHEAGVRLVIPYICSMFVFGDAEKRQGYWRFYDNWERYSRFGFGAKPKRDPKKWCYASRRSLGAEVVKRRDGQYVYEPCINHLDWRRFLRTVVAHIAKIGYDGVFVDVNASACRKACCRRLFGEYLAARYTGPEMEKLFGFGSPGEVRLGKRGDGLLWVETTRFRGERMADLFHELRDEGRKHRDSFLVIPNLSPFQHVEGVWERVGISQVFESWARECPVIMFEEMQQPGNFDDGVVSSLAFQYKYAFAQAGKAGCLLYNAVDSAGVQLAIAEAGAGGGGAFIQPAHSCPEIRREYRTFFRERPGLFEGLRPFSTVGLLFLYEQLAWGTKSHIEKTFRIGEELMAGHVLFDLVVERDLRAGLPRRYDALIACDVENLSSHQGEAILRHVREGGSLVALGGFGTKDHLGRRRRGGVLGAVPPEEWKEIVKGIRRGQVGKGVVIGVDDLDRVLSPAPFELFMVSEDESLDIDKIIQMIRKSKEGSAGRKRGLLPLLSSVTGEAGISNCDGTLRFNAYSRPEGDGGSLVLHAVNYDVPIHGRGRSGPVVPVARTRVSLPLPQAWKVESVKAYDPPSTEGAEMPFEQQRGVLELVIPHIDAYSIVQITYGS